MLLLQGHCKPVISRRWKVVTGKKEAYRITVIHSVGNSTHHKQRVYLMGKTRLQYWIDTGPTWGSSYWDGRENGWMVLGGQVQSQLLEQCCRNFCESILSCEDKTCPPGYRCCTAYSAADCLPFLYGVWAWSCCHLGTVTHTDGDWTTAA